MNIKYIKTTDNTKYDLRDKRIVDTDNGVATQSTNGLLSSTDKKKLDGIASGAEVNQNAFSNIKIGNTTIVADGKTDTVELTAGNNITITPDATNDKITIAATDTNTTYTFAGGTNLFTVTPSNGTAQTVSVTPSIANNVTGSGLTAGAIVLGNGNSTIKTSSKTIVTTLGNDNATLPTSKAVKDAINALPEPMIFKGTLGTGGTITSLPAAASGNNGFTYKVITAGTYASQSAKVGDVFISNGSSWNLIPSGDEPSGTVTNIATGTGLTGGPITSSGTISHADTSSQASVSNSGRTYILSITLDSMGHVTGIASATETVVNTDEKVKQRLDAGNANRPLLFSRVTTEQTATDSIDMVYRNNSIYVNPSTGTIIANKFNGGTLELYPLEELGYATGIRIHSIPSGVASLVFCGTDNTGTSGTSVNSWFFGTKNGNIYLNRYVAATAGPNRLWGHSNGYTIGNTTENSHNFTVGGTSRFIGSATFDNTVTASSFVGPLSGNASSASELTTDAGSATQPVYFSGGVPIACSYQLNKTVPSNAVFTDTHYVTHLYAGRGTAANAATTNGNTKLTVVDNTTGRESVTIKGTGGTTVSSDAGGVVTINSADTFSKQFTFPYPVKEGDSYYFIISPKGNDTITPTGTCYFVEITALINNGPDSFVTRSAKFMTNCYWFSQNSGLRITNPVYNSGYTSDCPILYHDKAQGADVGTETYNYNVCNIPFKLTIETGLMSVNIRVEGPGVSECTCSRLYTSFKWPAVEPDWSFV